MTPEERTLLTGFLQDLHQAQGGLKDAEAAQMIDQAIRTCPDAAYLLVQHAILADQALHAAQARIAELEAQVRGAPAQSSSFLGGSTGPWGPHATGPTYPNPNPPDPRYQAQPQYHAQPPGAPETRPGLFGAGPAQPGGFGSFLRNAGTTAAGVAGGAFLFDSLAGLFGGHRGFGGWGGGFGGAPVENVTINEYGGDPGYGQDPGYAQDYAQDPGGYDDSGDGGFGDDGGYDDGGVN